MKNMTLLISTCDNFSDIWDIHCRLLNKNWGNRNVRSLLVTDEATKYNFPGVEVLSAGIGAEMPQRLRYALKTINTDYVFLTLDDYLLVNSVNNDKIESLVEAMDDYKLDYIRLYKYPKSRNTTLLNKKMKLHKLSFDKRYDVNLYPGIWRTSFLKQTLENGNIDAWNYEVSLTKIALKNGARCAWVKEDVFYILDSIRKGKFLHKSKRYIENYEQYTGTRETISYTEEFKLWFKTKINTYMPNKIRILLKKIGRRIGMDFFSLD